MSKKPFRVLALWDYNSFTGYSTVSRNLVYHWKRIFGNNMFLDIVAINHFGNEYQESDNIRVISAKNRDMAKDDFGRHVFLKTLKDGDYDLIFILQDLGVIVPMIRYLKDIKAQKKKNNQKQFKSIFYFPVDFALTPNLVVGLDFFDTLVTYTEYGRSNVLRLLPEVQKKLKVLPHGTNTEDFFPLDPKEAETFRKEYFGENADKFIVGSVNRNQSRKDIPTTIFAFLEYWDNYNKNSFLYLHMNPHDPMGWKLKTILSQTPLTEGVDYMFQDVEEYLQGTDIKKLNKIYNSLDVFVSTTTGEGYGLTITEAMATKTPIIVPNHTSIKEIINDGERGNALNSLYPIVAMVDNVVRFQSDIYEIAEFLHEVEIQKITKDKVLDNKLEKAYEYIKKLDWKWIAESFSDEIKRLI